MLVNAATVRPMKKVDRPIEGLDQGALAALISRSKSALATELKSAPLIGDNGSRSESTRPTN